ncbi:hypothetical protein G9A89_009346 [Geosiphon pyriformis]|nr:hypothetical protein G9A89_009346 [Geosiphon pyriformis]
MSDFYNHCWIERLHIVNLIKNKDILVKWVKVEEHSGIPDNIRTDELYAKTALVFKKKRKATLAFVEYVKSVVKLHCIMM